MKKIIISFHCVKFLPPTDFTTEVKLWDSGWLLSDTNELKLEVSKGLKVIELKLMSADASTKKDALIKLAEILLNKI